MASFDWLKTTPQYITFLIQTYFHWLPGKLVHKSVGESLWFSSGEELCPLLVREPFMFSVGDVFFRLTSEEHQLWACFYEWSALPFRNLVRLKYSWASNNLSNKNKYDPAREDLVPPTDQEWKTLEGRPCWHTWGEKALVGGVEMLWQTSIVKEAWLHARCEDGFVKYIWNLNTQLK